MRKNTKTYFSFGITLLAFLASANAFSFETEIDIKKRIEIANELYHSNPDSSYTLLLLANEKAKASNNAISIAETETYIGRYFLLKGELESAEKQFNSALKKYEEYEQLSGQAYIHKLKAIIQGRIGNNKEQNESLNKAKTLYEEAKDTIGIIRTLQNMTNSFIEQKDLVEAKKTLDLFSSFQKQFPNDVWYYYNQNWGIYYHAAGNREKALEFYFKAAEMAEKDAMTDSQCSILMHIGQLYLEIGAYPLAKKYLHESETLAVKNTLNYELEETLTELIILYQKEKDFERAFKYLKQQNVLRKSMYDLEKVNNINTYEKKLQLVEKEKIIAQKELDIERGNLLTEKAEYKNRLFLAIIAFVLLLTFFSLFMYLKTKKLNFEIGLQKRVIEEKNVLVEESLKSVKDSITYSKRLQEAILPGLGQFEELFPQSFIIYLPKDIVAGDFYWFQHINGVSYLAAADCTGHGVPGAMVSVVCSNALNRAVKEFGITDPGKILDKAKEIVEETFHSSDSKVRDGMDISLCSIKHQVEGTKTEGKSKIESSILPDWEAGSKVETQKFEIENRKSEIILQWAGANNPLWICRNDSADLEIHAPNKQAVGISETREPFTTHSTFLSKGDTIYLFTDGIADQFGGEKGKKLKTAGLKNIILKTSLLPTENRKTALTTEFENWKQGFEQVDDVCLISISI